MAQLDLREHTEGVLVAAGPGPWPTCIEHDGDRYYRFHDFVYVNKPLDELNEEQVLAICAVRSSLISDEHRARNASVRKIFHQIASAYAPTVLLEIGPGRNPLFAATQREFSYELAELDEAVITHLVAHGYSVSKFGRGIKLNLASESVDLIFAVFVLQFPIDVTQVGELTRVLRPEGLMVANMYRRTRPSRRRLQEMFKATSHEIAVIPLDHGIRHDHEYWIISRDLNTSRSASAIQCLRGD